MVVIFMPEYIRKNIIMRSNIIAKQFENGQVVTIEDLC